MSTSLPLIDVDRLQIGIYVVLDVGWRNHPFLRGSFTIRTGDHLAQLRNLGVSQVRWCPDRSIAQPLPEPAADPATADAASDTHATDGSLLHRAAASGWTTRPPQTEAQWHDAALRRLEEEYRQLADRHQQLLWQLKSSPAEARDTVDQLGGMLSRSIVALQDPSARLLSQRAGQQASGHEIGVAALSVLLGRDVGLSDGELHELAIAALLHDVGKLRLPRFLHDDSGRLTDSERRSYRRHVELGVEMAKSMALPDTVIRAIAEHHERCDGGGFPAGLPDAQIGRPGRIIAIVNRYHNLLVPQALHAGITPYQALQQMYGGERAHFDHELLSRFVRIMGVYPPGTLVELTDQRMAIVIASRPGAALSPRVQVIDTPDDETPSAVLDIDADSELRIRHSLAPIQLGANWARRARLLARAPIYVEAQPAPEWVAWSATAAEPTMVF